MITCHPYPVAGQVDGLAQLVGCGHRRQGARDGAGGDELPSIVTRRLVQLDREVARTVRGSGRRSLVVPI